MSKIRSIFTLGICIVLFSTLLFSNIILAQDGGSYDPWIDLNDDGIIDAIDLQALASIYGASGTPINKTELLLELEARLNSLNASLLTEYYNITDCDSLFALLAHLHSGDDVQGGTPEVDDIQLGSTEGNSIIYFYEDGTESGEFICWHDASDRFWVSDDTYISGDIDISGSIDLWGTITMHATTTRYYTIPTTAWLPRRDSYSVHRTITSLYTSTGLVTYWYAAVILPHGAVVTELTVWVWDNYSTDINVYLNRQTAGTSSWSQMAWVSSGGQLENYQLLSDSSISDSTIDNQNYAYYVGGELSSGDSNHRLGQVRITYTIDEPLP